MGTRFHGLLISLTFIEVCVDLGVLSALNQALCLNLLLWSCIIYTVIVPTYDIFIYYLYNTFMFIAFKIVIVIQIYYYFYCLLFILSSLLSVHYYATVRKCVCT